MSKSRLCAAGEVGPQDMKWVDLNRCTWETWIHTFLQTLCRRGHFFIFEDKDRKHSACSLHWPLYPLLITKTISAVKSQPSLEREVMGLYQRQRLETKWTAELGQFMLAGTRTLWRMSWRPLRDKEEFVNMGHPSKVQVSTLSHGQLGYLLDWHLEV